MVDVVQAVFVGMFIVIAGLMPWNILFAANLRYYTGVPWAVPLTAAYLWIFWRYLQGAGPPDETREARRTNLRAHRLPARVWAWSLGAGGLGIVALVLGLRVANRLVALPVQQVPDLIGVPDATMLALLLASTPVAGMVEEAGFRGYMQGPIERRYGLIVAILITGTMFAVLHLDFTPILWPYYMAVAAIYGTVTHLSGSILPAVVLHTAGNVYSNLNLWRHGQAEWQASSGPAVLIWQSGADALFWTATAAFLAVATAALWACSRLARVASQRGSSLAPAGPRP
jgi:membrane protease YdiL (CAAX protease family)